MSRVEVNKIQQQCGTTLTVGGGACKTAVVDATTVTLGRCGGTVSLASGATQAGFGRAGSVDWQTGSIKTTTFSAVDGEGYFVNTNAGAVTVNLPAGSAGAIVAIADYTRTFNTYNCTVTPNGSEKIGGATGGQSAVLDVAGQSATFVYVDSNEGWINVQETQTSQVGTNPYVVATVSGACNAITTCGDYKIATFKNPGTFCVSNAGTPGGSNGVEYLVVAGGGASGYDNGGGGGAGGVRFAAPSIAPLTYPAKPLAGPAPIAVTASPYPIQVGGGGPAVPFPSAPTTIPNGTPSIFDSITSAGGGFGSGCGGNMNPGPQGVGGPGGSGGGAGQKSTSSPMLGGTGNDPSVSPAQGTDGGPTVGTCNQGGAGGGGFVCAAAPKPAGNNNGSPGGDGGGFPTAFGSNGAPCGSYRYYGGGGGGGAGQPGTGTGGGPGLGGGGPGGSYSAAGGCGTANTGGGGGGAAQAANGSAGGSGIVVIRYKFQN